MIYLIYFAEVNDACLTMLGILFFIRELLKIVFILIPIGLIVMLTVDFVKGVISFGDDSKKILSIVLRRVIYTMVLFLIPTTIYGLFSALGVAVDDSESCWAYVNEKSVGDVQKILKDQEEKRAKEREEELAKLNNKVKEKKETSKKLKTIISEGDSDSGSTARGDITLDWDDLSKTSGLASSSDLKKALNNTKQLKKFAPYSAFLFEAEQKYKVNVFFLIGVEAHESGILSSPISQDCNNFGGVKGSPKCLGHGSYKKFKSKKDFIDYHADLLGNEYLKEDGNHYHGTSIEDIVGTYCGTGSNCSDWVSSVKQFASLVYNQARK